jgi:hypothetical protein
MSLCAKDIQSLVWKKVRRIEISSGVSIPSKLRASFRQRLRTSSLSEFVWLESDISWMNATKLDAVLECLSCVARQLRHLSVAAIPKLGYKHLYTLNSILSELPSENLEYLDIGVDCIGGISSILTKSLPKLRHLTLPLREPHTLQQLRQSMENRPILTCLESLEIRLAGTASAWLNFGQEGEHLRPLLLMNSETLKKVSIFCLPGQVATILSVLFGDRALRPSQWEDVPSVCRSRFGISLDKFIVNDSSVWSQCVRQSEGTMPFTAIELLWDACYPLDLSRCDAYVTEKLPMLVEDVKIGFWQLVSRLQFLAGVTTGWFLSLLELLSVHVHPHVEEAIVLVSLFIPEVSLNVEADWARVTKLLKSTVALPIHKLIRAASLHLKSARARPWHAVEKLLLDMEFRRDTRFDVNLVLEGTRPLCFDACADEACFNLVLSDPGFDLVKSHCHPQATDDLVCTALEYAKSNPRLDVTLLLSLYNSDEKRLLLHLPTKPGALARLAQTEDEELQLAFARALPDWKRILETPVIEACIAKKKLLLLTDLIGMYFAEREALPSPPKYALKELVHQVLAVASENDNNTMEFIKSIQTS